MKKIVAVVAAALLLCLPLAAHAAPMPWKTFSAGESSMRKDVVQSGAMAC